MKNPERQPERNTSTLLNKNPPPKRARFETDVAARAPRATLRYATVHKPEVALKISTTLKGMYPSSFLT
jgi:hypothetical protein